MGVIGGTLSQGMLGLFFGPVVLSVAWAILMAWVHGHAENPDEKTPL
jgi:predicted PurR-regulated permease PerM